MKAERWANHGFTQEADVKNSNIWAEANDINF